MWRATLATALLLIGTANASFFSEGGSGRVAADQQQWDEYAADFYKNRQPQLQKQEVEEPPLGGLDEAKLEELLREVNQLNEEAKLAADEDRFVPASADEQFLYEDDKQNSDIYRDNQYFDQAFPQQPEQVDIDLEKTKTFGGIESAMGPQSHPLVKADEPEEVETKKVEAKEQPEVVKEEPKTPIVAQKKGQYEFVEFVEPSVMKSSKSMETVEKRRVIDSSNAEPVGIAGFSQSGNVMFLVAATVFVVATVTGGGIFYKVHQNRQQPSSDFSHYAPAGPGKDKRGAKRTGDDTLAYKAQLHHYQQTKQKIISGDEGALPQAGLEGAYDDGAVSEEEEENNFSVYECPGLAPTGDIEVQNPNFEPNNSFRP
ncbi:hypothetical protein QR680_016580 [Steinernema hermaphroditum]|uniref:Uncharacterized protein n=1 Tax=Steinernema hermaphroditum TaxID=289476 RepID=A0AA39HBP0_9BILA|nr:hypothetical protein QR680_016580 [Steinernema hermaphroditum]